MFFLQLPSLVLCVEYLLHRQPRELRLVLVDRRLLLEEVLLGGRVPQVVRQVEVQARVLVAAHVADGEEGELHAILRGRKQEGSQSPVTKKFEIMSNCEQR